MIDECQKTLYRILWLEPVRDIEIAMADPISVNVCTGYLSFAVIVVMEFITTSVDDTSWWSRGFPLAIDYICSGDRILRSCEVDSDSERISERRLSGGPVESPIRNL